MRDISFMPERHVLKPHYAVCAHDSGHPTNTFGKDRVAFVRHSARSFLTWLEFLLRFTHFGALPVANLQSELVQRRSNDRQRAKVFRIVVALDNLGRNRRGPESQTFANLFFDLWIEVGKRADRPTDFADRYRLARFLQPVAVATHLVKPKRKGQTE